VEKYRLPAMNRDVERVIFIDETCTRTDMTPTRGRTFKGKGIVIHAPSDKWRTITFIAELRRNELTAPFCFEGQWMVQPLRPMLKHNWHQHSSR